MKDSLSLSKRNIAQVIHIKDKSLFPINWLQKQDYCEYQVLLENIKGIKFELIQAMVESQKHEQLYGHYAQEVVPAMIEEMFVESRTVSVLSREFKVLDIAIGKGQRKRE